MISRALARRGALMSRKRPSHKGFRRTRVFACFNSSFVASCNFLQPRFAKRRMSRKRPSYQGFRCIAVCIVHRHASRAFHVFDLAGGPAGRRIACSGGAAPISLGRCRGVVAGRGEGAVGKGDRMTRGLSEIATDAQRTTNRPRKRAESNHHRPMVRRYEITAAPITKPVAQRRAA